MKRERKQISVPAPKRARVPLRRAFAPMRGRVFLREVRLILGWIRKKTNLGTCAKTRQSTAQTSIRAAARAGIFTGSSSNLGLDKKKTNLGTRAKTRQSAAQTSIRADARAGIIQWRICPVARRHEAEYQRRYGAFWRRVRIRRCALGKLTVMVVPLSGPLSTSIFPPCALTIAWIIVIPKPCPSVFVV